MNTVEPIQVARVARAAEAPVETKRTSFVFTMIVIAGKRSGS